ncbi:MAG: hypothetical protein AAF291_15590 [Pseudomonadota bacterium]
MLAELTGLALFNACIVGSVSLLAQYLFSERALLTIASASAVGTTSSVYLLALFAINWRDAPFADKLLVSISSSETWPFLLGSIVAGFTGALVALVARACLVGRAKK